MKNTDDKSTISNLHCRRADKASLPPAFFRSVALSLLLPFVATAADKSVDIGPVLGKDGDAFAKRLDVKFEVRKVASRPGNQGLGYCMLRAEVPNLGLVALLTDNQKEDGAIKHMEVFFTDRTVNTWQAAFLKLGIPSATVKEESVQNYIKVTLPPIDGKVWQGYFYAKNGDDPEGRPWLTIGVAK